MITMKVNMRTTLFLLLVVLGLTGICITGAFAQDSASSVTAGTKNISVDDLIAKDPNALFIYSGAGLKKPVQEIGSSFTDKTGIPVVFNFQGSGALISQMQITHKGDVFIPGGTPDYRIAQEKNLVGEPQYLAYHVPIIAIRKGNPDSIMTVKDFARPGLKIGLGDINATAIGKAGEKLFQKYEIAKDVEKNVIVRTATINELVTAMNAGSLDATLLTLDQINSDTMDSIPLSDSADTALIVPIGITTFSKNIENANAFIDYAASDEGKAYFKKYGFPAYPDPEYEDVQP